MPKKDAERHTTFISVVFKPAEGRSIEAAADKAHMKKSAWLRGLALKELERAKRRKK